MGIIKKLKKKWEYRKDRKLFYKVDEVVDYVFTEFMKLDFDFEPEKSIHSHFVNVILYKNLKLKYWEGEYEFNINSLCAYGFLIKNDKEIFSWNKCQPHYKTIQALKEAKKAIKEKDKKVAGQLLIDVFAEHHVIPDNLEDDDKQNNK